MPSPLLVTFAAGMTGLWRVDRITPVCGETLPAANRISIYEGEVPESATQTSWILRGTTSNMRYTNRVEIDALTATQQGLARTQSSCAALIPIRKTQTWWDLAQDERRAIFEEQSRHMSIGMEYLPAIARRLHHSRELGEPFDFLTWFEYAPEHGEAFEELLRRLRQTREWNYVDREVDIRLSRITVRSR